MTYAFHTEPFKHQRKTFNESCELPLYALFWEQGTGKTKLVIDTVAHLYETMRIDALLIVADNGVHRNWIDDEIPEHMPPRLEVSNFVWDQKKVRGVAVKAALEKLLLFDGLVVLAVNVDATITDICRDYLKRFLKERTVLYCVDESSSIKTPGAKRTKRNIALGQHAPFRRLCNGTPAAESPFNLYSQMAFLDRAIIGQRSYLAFKHEFGIWEKGYRADNKSFPLLLEYKNLDRLINLIAPFSSRVEKSECLDLPPKLYQKRYFDLHPKQRKLYDKLRDEFILELEELSNGESVGVVVQMAITRMLRLQQVACGYVPSLEKDEPVKFLPYNPRLDALKQLVGELSKKTKAIIWARFIADIDSIMNLLGDEAVRYDGKVSNDQRAKNKKAFQHGKARFLVGNPKAGGKGLTLTAATVVVYYSNYYGLEVRLHSEDRAHRHGQEHPVTIIDMVALNTVDDKKIVPALRKKKKIADLITGDETGDWL